MRKLLAPTFCVLLAACGGSGSGDGAGGTPPGEGSATGPAAPTAPVAARPTTPDPLAWSRYFVRSFDQAAVRAVRRTAAFSEHAIDAILSVPNHPVYGGAGVAVQMNPLLEARIDYARSVGLTGRGQLLSMVDGMPRLSHEQFAGKQVFGFNTGQIDSHGTAVAGILTGTGAGRTLAGVAPEASLHHGVIDWRGAINFNTLAGIMRDAQARGAVVSNNSWTLAGFTASGTNLRRFFEAPSAAEYLSSLRDFTRTGVVVFAVGNTHGATSVSGLAALPGAFPELEGSWIAVVNAIPTVRDGRIVSATRISTACLEAARWCISANGQINVPSGESDRAYATASGSSFATPQVSGAIALLAEAFPTLTAGQLRDRLLATADNGFFQPTGTVEFAPGVVRGYNAEFGLGFLDMRAALLPIGDHVIPLADGGVRNFADAALIAGGAVGDAPLRALAEVRIVSLDGLHGRFESDARTLVGMEEPRDRASARMLGRAISPADVPLFDPSMARAFSASVTLPERDFGTDRIRFTVPVDGSGRVGLSIHRDMEAVPGELILGLSVSRHSGSVMGLRVSEAEGALSGYSVSSTLGVGLGTGRNGRIGLEAEVGLSSARAAGMLDAIGGVRFNGLSLRYTREGVVARGDRLEMSASRPIAVTSGRARMALPVALSNGQPVFRSFDVDLAPRSRQTDLSVEYRRPLTAAVEVRGGIIHSLNHGHRAGVHSTGGVLGVSMHF